MNLSIPKRFLIITTAAYILAFLFFLVVNNIQFSEKTVDLYFKTGWIINRTMLQFFEYLIPVQGIAILFTFSVFYPKLKSESGFELLTVKAFNSFVTVVIIILLSLTALFFTGSEIFKPGFHKKLDTYVYLTKASRAYLEQAETAAEDGRLFDAEDAVKRYLAIKTDDAEGEALYKAITARIENQYSAAEPGTAERDTDIDSLDLSYDDALRLAKRYLELEDFYSAYYYAQIASGLSGSNEESKSIRSRAWASLSKTAPSKEETEEFRLFSDKKRGTELLLSNKPIDAYYLFNQLNVEHSADPDISKYLNESIRETRKLTYFINEAEDALNFPGFTDIAFLNSNTDDSRELIFFGKMVTMASGTYFEDIETVVFNPETGIKNHMTARYGKLSGDHIVLNGIDRENRNIRIYPEYLTADKLPELYNTLKLNIDWTLLHGLSSSGNIYKKMSLLELIKFEPVISDYGWMVEPLYIEIITRVLNPCGFMILSLIMIVISWNYRKFTGRIPVAGFILLPVIVYITALFSETYIYAMRLLCSWIFLDFGKPAAQILLASSQIVLLIAAFLLIAGLGTGERRESA